MMSLPVWSHVPYRGMVLGGMVLMGMVLRVWFQGEYSMPYPPVLTSSGGH